MEADFSEYKVPGEYRLMVPGLGASFPFFIDDADRPPRSRGPTRSGIYHQRCGTANALPFTRFTHGPCHTAPAEVPDPASACKFDLVNESLPEKSSDYNKNPRHTAPQLKNVASPVFIHSSSTGPVDVRGGHHDAGDYSKYTDQQRGLDSLSGFRRG